jgi:endogenous inhibitor of DNA gyrase (YacG/DUF329 family)
MIDFGAWADEEYRVPDEKNVPFANQISQQDLQELLDEDAEDFKNVNL